MCLAVPLRLVEITDKSGLGEFGGVTRQVRLDFVPKAVVGDFVLVHAGFAIEIVDKKQAELDREAYSEVLDAL